MQTRHNGTLTLRNGRRTLDGILIEAEGNVRNGGEIFTVTTISSGSLFGSGTLWARWDTSEYIGGFVEETQTVIYYGDRPVEQFMIQIQIGSFLVGVPDGQGSVFT